jgi:hypothetical protein
MPPNFYYNQQDFLEEFQKGKRWTWSVGRPHAVCGFSTGGPMNLTLAIAVYANISKALGLPLSFPGKLGAYSALYQCTDAALLAKTIEWMATEPKCANQAFNITNSDLIRWQNIGPKFADFFGLELAPPRHISLARVMADKGYGMASSRKTGCRNTATRTLQLGAIPTAFSHRTTISSRIRAKHVASDFTTWWTLRKCFFGCFQIFGVTGSFRDLPMREDVVGVGLAELDFLVLFEIVHIEIGVGFEPVLVGLDG